MRSTVALALILSACGGSSDATSTSSSSAIVCMSWRDCPSDTYCSASTQIVDACGTCVGGMPEGTDCGRFLFANEPIGCASGLHCAPDTVSPNGASCRRKAVLAEGASCTRRDDASVCGPGLACGGPHERCIPKAAPRSVLKGGECSVTADEPECVAPYACARGVCDGDYKAGEACDEELRPCGTGLVCTSTGLCEPPLADGWYCRRGEECASGGCAIDPNDNRNAHCSGTVGKGEVCNTLVPCAAKLGCSAEGVCVGVAHLGDACDDLAKCYDEGSECREGVCVRIAAVKCGR